LKLIYSGIITVLVSTETGLSSNHMVTLICVTYVGFTPTSLSSFWEISTAFGLTGMHNKGPPGWRSFVVC